MWFVHRKGENLFSFLFSGTKIAGLRDSQRRYGVVGRVELTAHRAPKHLASGIEKPVRSLSVSVGAINRSGLPERIPWSLALRGTKDCVWRSGFEVWTR